MGTTNFESSVKTTAISIRDGVKNESTAKICRVDTGSYIYEAFLRIYNGNNTEIWVTKSNKVSMTNRYSQVLAKTQVRVSNYGIEYDNQGGKITIPVRLSKQLIKYCQELNNYLGR